MNSKKHNQKWKWILGGCGCFIALVVSVSIAIFLGWSAFKAFLPSALQMGSGILALDGLEKLEESALTYEQVQQKRPIGFTDFVTNDSEKTQEPDSVFTLDMSEVGSKTGDLCQIQVDKIICSGVTQESRFPMLPGSVTYFFNQGRKTFTLHCDGGDNPPEGWKADQCRVENSNSDG